MKQAGISQAELAERSGMSRTHINRLANCRETAHVGTLLRILKACGLDLIDLRVKKPEQDVAKSVLLGT